MGRYTFDSSYSYALASSIQTATSCIKYFCARFFYNSKHNPYKKIEEMAFNQIKREQC